MDELHRPQAEPSARSQPCNSTDPSPGDARAQNVSQPHAPSSSSSLSHLPSNTRAHLDDAVTSAIDSSDMSSKVDPELVAIVTNQVINSLKAQGIETSRSPTTASSTTAPPRDVYTPPSPAKLDETSLPNIQPLQIDDHLDGQQRRRPSADKPFLRELPPPQSRPPPPANVHRQPSSDATTLEKIWQPLFDNDGRPTFRLAQFLRGLALNIIEDYEPTHSIVIMPQKMKQFYAETTVGGEIYPWNTIFGGGVTNSSLSHLYRDLKCEHFFVQSGGFDEKPTVPALTPLGFETWFTYAIRSHPDLEWQRFSKALLSMPISNFCDRKERFPKELPRRLFPAEADEPTRTYFEDSILADEAIHLLPRLTRVTSAPSATAASSSRAAMKSSFAPSIVTEGPYHQRRGTESSEHTTDEQHRGSISIERERKPYSATPGHAKQYEDGDTSLRSASKVQHSNTQNGRTAFEAGDDGSGWRQARSGSLSQASNYTTRRRVRSPSTTSRGNPNARPEDPASGAMEDEGSWRRHREAKEQQRAMQAREYVMEGTKSQAATDMVSDHSRRRMSVPVNQAGMSYPPPPSSRFA